MDETLLQGLMEVFPNEGSVVPEIELQFRFGSQEGFSEGIQELLDSNFMIKYEFNKAWYFKCKRSLAEFNGGASSSKSGGSDNQLLQELAEVVKVLASKSDDGELVGRIDKILQKLGN